MPSSSEHHPESAHVQLARKTADLRLTSRRSKNWLRDLATPVENPSTTTCAVSQGSGGSMRSRENREAAATARGVDPRSTVDDEAYLPEPVSQACPVRSTFCCTPLQRLPTF